MLPIYPQAVFFDFSSEGLAIDSQNPCRLLAFAFSTAQDELNIPFFKFLEGETFFGKHLKLALSLGNKSG